MVRFISYFSCFKMTRMKGGHNFSDISRRIMSHVFTTSLARQLNWMGTTTSIQQYPSVIQMIAGTQHSSFDTKF